MPAGSEASTGTSAIRSALILNSLNLRQFLLSALAKQRRTRIRNGKAVIDNPAPGMNPRTFKIGLQVCRFQYRCGFRQSDQQDFGTPGPEAASSE
jgi:hypothetical protein